MSALRVSYPGRQPVLVDLGPASASTGELRGTFAVPARSCLHDREETRRARMASDCEYAERRRQQQRAADARYRARRAAA